MRTRVKLVKPNYFVSEKTNIKFISTGCAILDCALGGGWAVGRIVNIVGDKSTAKTALATETLINFKRKYPKASAAYRDAEAAFDVAYAEAMGLKPDSVDFGNDEITTVEGFARDLELFLSTAKSGQPCLYILDSLDALSDEAEMKRDYGEASYGTGKAKMLSELFRKLKGKLAEAKCLLVIVSQVRDNIGAMMGEKHKRSGGRALDFYASQVLWLANLGAKKRTVSKIERADRIRIKANVKKNKVGFPFRTCEFEFVFGYGIDDVGASVEWLDDAGKLRVTLKEYRKVLAAASDDEYDAERSILAQSVKKAWAEVEVSFLPKRRKYR